MKDYTISETFILPSRGKVYEIEVKPEVQLRSMTTKHEMQRLSPSELPYKNMCQILDDCIVNDIGISSYDLCLGDYQFLIYKLRSVTYGSDITLNTVCPTCRTQEELKLSLEDFPEIPYSEEIEKYKTVILPTTNTEVKLKLQTPRTIDKITLDVKEIKRRHKGSDEDPTLIYSIANSISEIDGKQVTASQIEDWVRNLPMRDTNTIINYVKKLNDSIGIDIDIETECERCRRDYTVKFKVTPEFFRPAIEI